MGKRGRWKCEGRIMKEEAGDVADSKGGETTGAKGRVRPRFLSALSALSAVQFLGLESTVTRRLERQRYEARRNCEGRRKSDETGGDAD